MSEGVTLVGKTKGPEDPAKNKSIGSKVTEQLKKEFVQTLADYLAFKRKTDPDYPEINESGAVERFVKAGLRRWQEEMAGGAPEPGRPGEYDAARDGPREKGKPAD